MISAASCAAMKCGKPRRVGMIHKMYANGLPKFPPPWSYFRCKVQMPSDANKPDDENHRACLLKISVEAPVKSPRVLLLTTDHSSLATTFQAAFSFSPNLIKIFV